MTDVYHGEDIAFDLYPKTDPKNGPRIRRLTSLQRGSFIRREQKGTGVVTIVIPGDSDDAEAIDPALGHYIKAERKGAIVNLVTSAAADDIVDTAAAHGLVVDDKLEFVTLTGGTGLSTTPAYYVQSVPSSTSLKVAANKGGAAINFTTDITAGSIRKLKTVAGGFLLGGNYNALSADGTKPLVLTGPGPLHYLARARMAPHSYLGDDPQPEGVWPLHNQGAWFGDDHYGSEFARALTEMKSTQADDPGDDPDSPHPNDNDRLDDPLPALTFDFDGFTDSLGNAWTGARGEFDVQVALEDGLRIAFRFMQAGVEIDINPDTFELHAYNAGTLGTDRTGLAWGAGVVRFQVPTNDKVDTSNVFTTAKRALSAFIQRSLVWAGREDIWGVARNASAPVRWEGGYSSGAGDEAANNTIAGQQIVERTDAGDVPRLKVWAGNDESKGQYTYGPGGHADIWDRGTVHSGTGTWDWNQWTAPLSALEWRIENPNGEFDTYVEFGSTFRSIDEVMRFAGGAVGAHTHPPNPRLCPNDAGPIVSGEGWKAFELGSEPSGWKLPGFDDSGWTDTQDQAFTVAALAGMRPSTGYVPGASQLYRREYWIDESTLSGADVVFKYAIDNAGTIYVNGVAIATLTGTGTGNYESDHATTLPRSAFRAGYNCIAISTTDDGLVGSGAAVYIDINANNGNGTSKFAARCDKHYHASDIDENNYGDLQAAVDMLRARSTADAGLVLNLTTAPRGGGARRQDGAVHRDGWTYFAYLRGDNNDVAVSAYCHASGAVATEQVLHAALEDDADHALPVLMIRDDGKLAAFYSEHNDAQLRMRVSTNTLAADPDLSGGFAAEVNLDPQLGGTAYTYAHAARLADEHVLVVRTDPGSGGTDSHNGQIWMLATSPNGDTWTPTTIVQATPGLYIHPQKTSETRIDFIAWTQGATTAPLYHFYYEGGSYFRSDGTDITADLPLTAADLTTVHTPGASALDLGKSIRLDDQGNPRVLFRYRDSSAVDHLLYGAWDGSAWNTVEVREASTGVIDQQDARVVWTEADVDGTREIFRYVQYGDDFVETQITAGSSEDQGGIQSVTDYADDLKVVWQAGILTSATVWSTGMRGYGEPTGGGLHDHDDVGAAVAAHDADADAHAALLGAVSLIPVDVGTPSYTTSGDDVEVQVATVWGFDGTDGYYNAAGATAGEEAALYWDPDAGDYVLVEYSF